MSAAQHLWGGRVLGAPAQCSPKSPTPRRNQSQKQHLFSQAYNEFAFHDHNSRQIFQATDNKVIFFSILDRADKQNITLNIHSSFRSFIHDPPCALQIWVNATAVWLPGTKALSGFVHEAAHRSPQKQCTAELCLRGSAASREVVFRPCKAVRASPAPRDTGTSFVPRKLFGNC